jgi:hypothetical protein
MGRRKAAGTRLDQAKDALEDINARIAKLTAWREGQLLADATAADIAKIDTEIATLQHAARTEVDRVRLLEAKAVDEEAAERIRRHEAHIRQVEKLGDDFVAAGVKLAEATANLVAAYRETVAAAERRGAAWPWAPQDQGAAMLTGVTVQLALSHEFFRISHVPFLGGRPGEKLVPGLPGSSCSRPTDLLGFPEREPALIDVCKIAAEYARRRMREISAAQPELPPLTSDALPAATNGNAEPPVQAPPAATPAAAMPPGADTRSPDQQRLAALWAEQNRLALSNDPDAEEKYQAVVKEIASISATIGV